jgi:hypothetical protein
MPIAKRLASTASGLILGLKAISFVFSFGDHTQKLALARCELALSLGDFGLTQVRSISPFWRWTAMAQKH